MTLKAFLKGQRSAALCVIEASASGGPEARRKWQPVGEVPRERKDKDTLVRVREELLLPTWEVRENDFVRVTDHHGRTLLFGLWMPDAANTERLHVRLPMSALRLITRNDDMESSPRRVIARVLYKTGEDWWATWMAPLSANDLFDLASKAGTDDTLLLRAMIECIRVLLPNVLDPADCTLCRDALDQIDTRLESRVALWAVHEGRVENRAVEAEDARGMQGEESPLECVLQGLTRCYSALRTRQQNAWAPGWSDSLAGTLLMLERTSRGARRPLAKAFREAVPLVTVLRALVAKDLLQEEA